MFTVRVVDVCIIMVHVQPPLTCPKGVCRKGFKCTPILKIQHIQIAVGHSARRFYSFSQHDSQEFLTYLLEGLHEDLKKPSMTRDKMQDEYKSSVVANGSLDNDQVHEASSMCW